jgi:hypothetical protein
MVISFIIKPLKICKNENYFIAHSEFGRQITSSEGPMSPNLFLDFSHHVRFLRYLQFIFQKHQKCPLWVAWERSNLFVTLRFFRYVTFWLQVPAFNSFLPVGVENKNIENKFKLLCWIENYITNGTLNQNYSTHSYGFLVSTTTSLVLSFLSLVIRTRLIVELNWTVRNSKITKVWKQYKHILILYYHRYLWYKKSAL